MNNRGSQAQAGSVTEKARPPISAPLSTTLLTQSQSPTDRTSEDAGQDLATLLRAETPNLVRLATGTNDPDIAARLLILAERIEAREKLDEEEQERAAKALELVREAERLTPMAICARALRVLELSLQLDASTLDGWVKALRLAAGKARPTAG